MEAGFDSPAYSVIVVTSGGTRYDITGLLTDLSVSETANQLAQTAKIALVNILLNGSYLSEIIDVCDRVFIYGDVGMGAQEMFRGTVWTKDYTSELQKEITLTCYDNLIYFMKSEVCEYFSAGKSTSAICEALCEKWGIPLNYQYLSITHPKLPLRGYLADVLISDILEEVRKQTGVKYVIRSSEDIVGIAAVGKNETIYHVRRQENAQTARYSKTMEDVVTKVVITGKTDEDEKTAIEAEVSRNTDKYGTLQRLVSKDEDTSISEAEKEASEMLDENGEPKETVRLDAIDVPWLKKGDLFIANAGNLVERQCVVTAITHNCTKKTMSVEAEFYEKSGAEETKLYGEEAAGKMLDLSGVPLYISSDAKNKSTTVTGTYYLYDGIEVLGRYRITNSKSRVGAKPINSNVIGWIDKEYA